MKKFLSLVMALIMVMSLVTVASAADYTDAADVDKAEAVEVMSAVGVFQGSAGKFNPKGILNRAEAAKLIAYLDLGEKTAEALPAVQAFSDVPATHWAAKYVAYCADAGYINGVGDGKFDPTGKLTGYQFGKLLLCVLGYDYTIESFVGANWSIAVAKLMKSNDINDGVKAAPSAELTREDAAQYCLNALKATTVEYASKGTNVTINGVVIATGASKAESVYDTVSAGATAIKTGTVKDSKYTVELGEKLYEGDLILNDSATDDFGRTSNEWTYKNDEIGSYGKTAKFIYTAETSEKTIAADLKGYTIGDYKVSADVKPSSTSTLSGVPAYSVSPDGTKSTAKLIAGVTKNGKQVEIFVNSDKQITKILPITYSVYEVETVTKKTNGDVFYAMKKLAGSGSSTITLRDYNADSVNDDNFVADCDLAKGTVVTVAAGSASGSTVYYVYGTTSVTGVVTESKANDYVIVSGTKYPQANGLTAPVQKDAQDLVIDQFGAVVYTEDAEKNSDAVYIAYLWPQTTTYGNTVTMAQIVDQQGNVTEIEVENTGDLAGVGVYTYYVTSDDTAWVTLESDTAKAAPVTDPSMTTSTVKLGTSGATYYFADDVTFVNMKTPGAKLKVTVSTGVQKVSSLAGAYAVMDDGEIITLFIPAAPTTAVDKDDLLFVADPSTVGDRADNENKSGPLYKFYQKGEKKTEISNNPGSKGFFSYSIDSKTGRYTLTPETTDVYSVTVDTRAGKVYAIAQDAYVSFTAQGLVDAKLAADCEFYDTTDNDIVSLATLVDVVENNDDITALELWALYDSKKEVITCVYITKV